MKNNLTKKYCKKCNNLLRHVIVYDCSWYRCEKCNAIYDIEEYWRTDEQKVKKTR